MASVDMKYRNIAQQAVSSLEKIAENVVKKKCRNIGNEMMKCLEKAKEIAEKDKELALCLDTINCGEWAWRVLVF